MLGCVVGLETSVTGITLIALGTSLPDTFASRTAAIQDEHADAAIGNITGYTLRTLHPHLCTKRETVVLSLPITAIDPDCHKGIPSHLLSLFLIFFVCFLKTELLS